MDDNSKVEMVFDLLNSIDYDDYKDEIDEKCRKLIKEFIQERKEKIGYVKKTYDENDYLNLKEIIGNKSVMKNFKSFKSFDDYYND